MTLGSIIYTILFRPLQLLFEMLYMFTYNIIGNPGLSIVVLSLSMNFLVLPLYRRADTMQEEERDMENRLHDGVKHIKKTFKGDERMMILQTYYRQNNYKPTDVLKGSVSLFLEIPFFVAAYQFLSHLELLQGVSFGLIRDLGAADGLLRLGGLTINLLPIIMTGVNLISCVIFTKGYPLKTKLQLYSMAIFFLFFLYSSPAGLVFYWTLNNLFSLVKTIFYKLKNPRRVFKVMAAIFGFCVVGLGIFMYHPDAFRNKLLVICVGVAFILPLVRDVVRMIIRLRGHEIDPEAEDGQASDESASESASVVHGRNGRLYVAAVFYLIILTGAMIPSSVIKASPQEFVNVFHYVNPLWYVVSALCLAIGTFGVWFGIFRWLADERGKSIFDMLLSAFCLIATITYMFFGRNLGIMSNSLVYEGGLSFSDQEKMVNLLLMLFLFGGMVIAFKHLQKIMPQIFILAGVALVIISGVQAASIQTAAVECQNSVQMSGEDEPAIPLSTQGKNVVVIMLDRAMGELIPYFLQEKPELKEIYEGFTYYPNTISYGAHTNIATPALFGGYEYTPFELNKRDSEPLVDKQNEALKVMPVLFAKEGYQVTVTDPPYANYQWNSDLSIYDEYPEIKGYITKGRYYTKEGAERWVEGNQRNFFCYSIVKCLPLMMQNLLYEDGNYLNSANADHIAEKQRVFSPYTAKGLDLAFMESFTVLENLENMTHISDSSENTFLMMSNDSTHAPMLLQVPEYTYASEVDNTAYEEAHQDRYTLNGVTLCMDEARKYAQYSANMAALLEIGKWLQFLRDNDLYDNTRIIIVSDHGCELPILGNRILNDDEVLNLEKVSPLLMVKDFDATEFTISEEFMTNGDVPTLATREIVENPMNPFTGKKIDDSYKEAGEQYVFLSEEWDAETNNGNQFIPGPWLSVQGDMRINSNWKILQGWSTSPLEKK